MSFPELIISNPRICRFYSENTGINFEAVNLIFIDLFDQLLRDMNSTMTATVQSQILSSVHQNTCKLNELNTSVHFLNEKMSAMHNDIINNIALKLGNVKQDYMDEINVLLQNNANTCIDTLLDKHNSALISKTTNVLHDIIPRTQQHYYSQIKETIQLFHKTLSEDTRAIIKHADSNTTMKEYLSNFEIKYSNMIQNLQQPVYSFISSSEDRIQSSLKENVCKNADIHTKIMDEVADALNAFRNSFYQTAKQTTQVHIILSRLYSTSEVHNYNNHSFNMSQSNPASEMSTFILKRNNYPKIVIQNIDVERNVSVDEIKSFKQIIEHNSCCGIFFSQKSGFANKPDFHIETHNKLVLMYVHNVDYSPEKIKMSIDILDNVFYKICDIMQNNESGNLSITTIEKDVLEEINKEYQSFMIQKDTMMNVVKETQKTLFAHIDDLKFPMLDKYLSTKFTVCANKPGLKCDLCKTFLANNLKALAAHKRGCVRKISGNILPSE